jgi:hypothetical protein
VGSTEESFNARLGLRGLGLGARSLPCHPLWTAKLCAGRSAALGRVRHMRVRDLDEMVFIACHSQQALRDRGCGTAQPELLIWQEVRNRLVGFVGGRRRRAGQPVRRRRSRPTSKGSTGGASRVAPQGVISRRIGSLSSLPLSLSCPRRHHRCSPAHAFQLTVARAWTRCVLVNVGERVEPRDIRLHADQTDLTRLRGDHGRRRRRKHIAFPKAAQALWRRR